MSVPRDCVFPPQASATTGDDVAAARVALSFLPSRQVDAPESQNLRPDSHEQPCHPDPPEEPLALGADATQRAWATEDDGRQLTQVLVGEALEPVDAIGVVRTLDVAVPRKAP